MKLRQNKIIDEPILFDEQMDINSPHIPKENKLYFKTLDFGKTQVNIRKLKFTEVKEINSFNSDEKETINNKVILLATDLNETQVLTLPRVFKEVILLHIRSQSFIQNEFEFTIPCQTHDCDYEKKHKLKVDEIQINLNTPPKFISDEFVVEFTFDTFLDYSIVNHLKGEVGYDEEVLGLVSVIKSIEKVGTEVYIEKSFDSNIIAVESFKLIFDLLNEEVDLTLQIIDHLSLFSNGIQPNEISFKCKKCEQVSNVEVNVTDFF